MSEMVDRVAKAIYERYERCEPFHSLWDCAGLDKDYWRDIARAAIEAMRDPGVEFIWDAVYPIKAYDAGGKVAEQMYQAVIDAALNPSRTSAFDAPPPSSDDQPEA